MIFDGKPTSEITAADIGALRNRVEEDAFIDYKSFYERNNKGIHELLKDVTAFANAQGGYLIIGIGPQARNPRRPGGFANIQDPEGERTRILEHCLTKIEPRLAELDVRAIKVGRKTVLVCRVLESDMKPLCAKPDPEHHFFWRRYEDGNRLMSVPEIRECLEGDRVLRELSEMRREFAHMRQQQVVAHEAGQEIDEGNALVVTTLEAFRRFVDEQFEQATAGRPYYRLTATPLPINRVSLREHVPQLYDLLDRPPVLRPGGWDMASYFGHEKRTTRIGVMRSKIDYNHLRVLWNGHTEFWTEVDSDSFQFSEGRGTQNVEKKFLHPFAISEPLENLILFTKEVSRLACFEGEIEFGLGLYRIRGFYLAPGPPQSLGFRRARSDSGRADGAQPFPDENLLALPVRARLADLPDQVTWKLVSHVYQRFGYPLDEQVPFFDKEHRFALGQPKKAGGTA